MTENISRPLTQGLHSNKHTAEEVDVISSLAEAFENSSLPLALRLRNFPRHIRRQEIARFLARYEIFKSAMNVHGSVVECGVFAGGGLMSWAHFSSILEPYNHTRRIIGFDTFSGFTGIHEKDKAGTSEHLHSGAYATSASIQEEIQQLAKISDRNRPLGHIPKVELVAGDACQTIPEYVHNNSYLLLSVLYLDFDLYEPTKIALQYLYPRVVKGGIVAFDELNAAEFPGETTALLEIIGTEHARLQRFSFDPYISYFVKE